MMTGALYLNPDVCGAWRSHRYSLRIIVNVQKKKRIIVLVSNKDVVFSSGGGVFVEPCFPIKQWTYTCEHVFKNDFLSVSSSAF